MNKPPGVHGGDEHEAGGEGEAHRGATDGDLAVLEGLAQHLEDILLELGKLVEEEDAVVGEGDLARFGDGAAADQTGIGDGVVGGTKGAGGDQRRAVGEEPGDGMDFGCLEGFVEGLGRQNPRHAAGEHGLAAAWRTDHQQIMGTRGGNLEGALDVLLAAHFSEVLMLAAGGGEEVEHLDPAGLQLPFAGEKSDYLAEVAHAVDGEAVDDGSFRGVVEGQNQPVDPPAAGGDGDRQGAAHRLDAAVEGEFAEVEVAPGTGLADGAAGEKQADRHRQVEGGAVLADIGRGEVDGDAARRKVVTGVLDRRLDAVLALLDRPFGEADGGELGQALGNIDLNVDGIGVNAKERPGQNGSQHRFPPPAVTAACGRSRQF